MSPLILPYRGMHPRIDERAYLAPTAVVIGDVVIGPQSSVWFHAIVRGDVEKIRIGRRTNVQDSAVVHVTRDTWSTLIGDDVTLGHHATVHGCTIGNRVLVGIGAIVLDGAEIGDDCLIAAGALVPPGMKVPPRSLVSGVPGKVRRGLTDEEAAHLLWYANNYVEYSETYRAELGPPSSLRQRSSPDPSSPSR